MLTTTRMPIHESRTTPRRRTQVRAMRSSMGASLLLVECSVSCYRLRPPPSTELIARCASEPPAIAAARRRPGTHVNDEH
jgi:hypothetical protein